jgi:4-hydroxy-2-oxoheptanedioate aldolase
MRENKLARRLASEGALLGAYVPYASPDLTEAAGYLGFDWVFIDAEHGGIGIETAASMVRAADVVGLGSVIRVPSADPATVLRYVETGVDGILAPHVATSATATALVHAVRFPPTGGRGAFSRSRAANFGLTQSAPAYYAATQNHALAMAMVEDASAFDRLDELCAVDDLDLFFFGAGDLAMSMGYPGQPDHADVSAMIAGAARTLADRGKVTGMMAATPGAAHVAAALGCRLIAVDLGGLLAAGATHYLEEARRAVAR